jgi:hypothetical protein
MSLTNSITSSLIGNQPDHKTSEKIFKENLNQYDRKYNTLIDYVAIIGISNYELYEAVNAV